MTPEVSKIMADIGCLLSSRVQDASDLTVDRLSLLPQKVLDITLGKLSIIDAARTSVLAKDWRYKWLSSSKFDLVALDLNWDTVSSIVNKFLLLHTGTIRAFSLTSIFNSHYPDLDQWMKYLTEQGVEELSLKNDDYYSQHFEIPPHLFFFEKLKSLSLLNCALRVPATVGNFNSLLELCFEDVAISDDDFNRLILATPQLLRLKLKRISGLKHLRLYAPRLTELTVDIGMNGWFIGPPSCLVLVNINGFKASSRIGYEQVQDVILNWRSVIFCLSRLNLLQKLMLSGNFIKLVADDVLGEFPLRNDNLTYLSLDQIRFESINVFRVCLSLLKFCPNIKHFQFTMESAKGPKQMTTFLKENRGKFSFPKLESLKVECLPLSGMECTVNFIRFLCAHSPNLKVLNILMDGVREMNATQVSNLHSRFRNFCPNAEVLFEYTTRKTPKRWAARNFDELMVPQ